MTEVVRTEVKRVGLTAIRDELRALWSSEALGEKPIVQARSHNLVVYTDASRHNVDDLVEHIIRVNSLRPGRVLLVEYDPTADEKLDAWATIYCQLQKDHQVCSEMVVMQVGGVLRSEIHSTVISLLAPDLPVILWWMQLPDVEDHLYENVVAGADRLLIDSDFFPNIAEDFVTLASISSPPVGDLAWARLTPWRRRLAAFWDFPQLRESLEHIHSLEIQHAARKPHADSNRALLLVGWLAERLGWRLAEASALEAGGYEITYRHNGESIRVQLEEIVPDGVPPGELAAISLQAGHGENLERPHLRFDPEHGCIEQKIGDVAQRDWAFRPVEPAEALAEELDYNHDAAFQAALNQAVAIVRMAHR